MCPHSNNLSRTPFIIGLALLTPADINAALHRRVQSGKNSGYVNHSRIIIHYLTIRRHMAVGMFQGDFILLVSLKWNQ